jgi:uncharacterized protein YcgI (DUF1989 family)
MSAATLQHQPNISSALDSTSSCSDNLSEQLMQMGIANDEQHLPRHTIERYLNIFQQVEFSTDTHRV